MTVSRCLRRVLPAVGVAAVASALVSCSAAGTARVSRAQPAAVSTAAPPPDIVVSPADGSTDVRLDTAVSVSAQHGSLDSVTVHAAGDPTAVPGVMSSDSRTWKATTGLDPAVSYVVEASAHGGGGDEASARTSFATVRAVKRLTTDSVPADGDLVGVGMPIKLRFNAPVAPERQAALVQHLEVTSIPAVEGGWHWFAPDEVHYRTRDYWPVNTKVTLTAHLRGVDAGDNVWGLADWSMTFTIAPDKHVSTIDAATHQMVVTNNDQPLYQWPISAGKPGRPTLEGTLVVWYHQQDVLMDSATIGIPRDAPGGYYQHVFWDTAISTDGFYIHSAPWSVWAQGSQNVSHGCVNLSPERATTFYNFSRPGDVVIVKNTGRPADASDGEGDWQIPYDQWANSGGATAAPAAPAQSGGL